MLREDLNTRLKEAMREKDKLVLGTIRLILAALKDRDIAARSKGNSDGVDNDDILAMLQKMVKQREESAKMYAEAGRVELAEQEDAEIAVIKGFLPKQMTDGEVSVAIKTILNEIDGQSIKDMGRAMARLREDYTGQMDFGKASQEIKAILTGQA